MQIHNDSLIAPCVLCITRHGMKLCRLMQLKEIGMGISKTNIIVILGGVGLVTAVSVFAVADQNREHDEAASVANVKLTLSDAINYAQSEVPGKVLSAELDDEATPLVYKVEVVQLGKTREVLVDAQSGRVLSNKEDQLDGKSREEEDDDD